MVGSLSKNDCLLELSEKFLRIIHEATGPGKLAVEILIPRQRTAEKGLAPPPDSGKPDKRSFLPGVLDLLQPKASFNHTAEMVCEFTTLNL